MADNVVQLRDVRDVAIKRLKHPDGALFFEPVKVTPELEELRLTRLLDDAIRARQFRRRRAGIQIVHRDPEVGS